MWCRLHMLDMLRSMCVPAASCHEVLPRLFPANTSASHDFLVYTSKPDASPPTCVPLRRCVGKEDGLHVRGVIPAGWPISPNSHDRPAREPTGHIFTFSVVSADLNFGQQGIFKPLFDTHTHAAGNHVAQRILLPTPTRLLLPTPIHSPRENSRHLADALVAAGLLSSGRAGLLAGVCGLPLAALLTCRRGSLGLRRTPSSRGRPKERPNIHPKAASWVAAYSCSAAQT